MSKPPIHGKTILRVLGDVIKGVISCSAPNLFGKAA